MNESNSQKEQTKKQQEASNSNQKRRWNRTKSGKRRRSGRPRIGRWRGGKKTYISTGDIINETILWQTTSPKATNVGQKNRAASSSSKADAPIASVPSGLSSNSGEDLNSASVEMETIETAKVESLSTDHDLLDLASMETEPIESTEVTQDSNANC